MVVKEDISPLYYGLPLHVKKTCEEGEEDEFHLCSTSLPTKHSELV